MVKELSNFDILVQKLECQFLNDEEQLLLLAGTSNDVSLFGSNNCKCNNNNCQCQSNNCTCNNNNCQCASNGSTFVCAP